MHHSIVMLHHARASLCSHHTSLTCLASSLRLAYESTTPSS